jgi:mevalonate kinase
MLCGEYAVLQGATALALPAKKGQSLAVEAIPGTIDPVLHWQSFDETNECWYSAEIGLPHFYIIESTDSNITIQLIRFLITAKAMNPSFLNGSQSYKVETRLEFARNEGLGSSSTLTYNIAQWSGTDPFKLHFNAFKGSGFDVAVAQYRQPLLYQVNHQSPTIEVFHWQKPFNDKLFFVHLNGKQDTRAEIEHFKNSPRFSFRQIEELTRVSKLLSHTVDYFEFCLLLEIAEEEVSAALGRPSVKLTKFSDFKGTIKSLGAWGGDYIMATGENTIPYFNEKGYGQVVPFNEMIITG